MKDKKKPLGVYIHIPFCQSKCAYCDFLSGPASNDSKKEYVKALLAQMETYRFLASEYEVRTIFIGGGTPSCIEASDIRRILERVYDIFHIDITRNTKNNLLIGTENDITNNIASDVERKDTDFPYPIEITIEANPGTLTKEKLLLYKKAGINRISMGLQSSNNEELKLLGRIHTYEQFEENYYMARECGFDNINVDLMSALPGQTVESWEKTLHKICKLDPEHISAYSLIIEEGTPFYDRYKDSEGLPTEEDDRLMYHATRAILKAAGYDRYEISNYAKQGYESRHNSSYWERIDYIGFGLGASSCIDTIRFHNEDDLQEFIKQELLGNAVREEIIFDQLSNTAQEVVLKKLHAKEIKLLSTREQMEEFMFLGLRMMNGIDIDVFEQEFQVEFCTVYGHIADELVDEGLLKYKDKRVYLTERGIDISNYVMSEFLL